ncbi:phosphatase PAP2 family protein [Weeksellaceae bacterium KMM 9724]|uniref:phosphatase PAP2 family protein n=1 Tax=Profundicola chukchiensis TaxID=2961959 RepID=UPI00243D6E7E|nr:phosphatase PAP2 family protein [Profundicola chukchiensis]MDG4951378.1 phosphatase PAP2 family protein [Profundicola chukchiensis]
MQQNKDFILRNWPFLLVAFFYLILGISLNKYYGEDDLHLLLNQYHTPWLGYFFKYFTKTGELLFGLLIFAFIIWKSIWRMLLTFVSTFVMQAIIIIGMKRMFFRHHHRPGYYFQELSVDLNLVEGIKQGITFTFPSGHSSIAFFLFLFVSLLVKNNWVKFLLGIAAVLAAFSRIYLSQHFMQDTVAGAMIGMFSLAFCYYLWLYIDYPFLGGPIRRPKKKTV